MDNLTLYLICQFWALPIQQIKRYVKNTDKRGYNYLIIAENIVGIEEIARHEQFLLFPQCLKSCLLLMRHNEYLWSKGLNYPLRVNKNKPPAVFRQDK